MDLVTIRYNASAVKIMDGSAACNINDLTGDVLRITVTRRRKSEGTLIFFAEESNSNYDTICININTLMWTNL